MDPASALNLAWASLERANARLETIEVELARLKTARLVLFPRLCSQDELQQRLEYQWWREGGSSGLFESYPNLNSQIRQSGRLHTEVLADQARYREYTNELSRPYVRKLSVLDLPNETLLEIFKLAEGFDPCQFGEPTDPELSSNDPRLGIIRNLLRSNPSICPSAESIHDVAQYHDYTTSPSPVRPERDIQVIKACRLICHQFCDLSSHLAFRKLYFSLDERSLSRHRTTHLTGAQKSKLLAIRNTLHKIVYGTLVVPEFNHRPYVENYEKRQAEFREKHREYVALMLAQRFLLEGNVLEGQDIYSRFSAAILRMPAVRQLRFTDYEDNLGTRWQTVLSSNDVWTGLYEVILRPRFKVPETPVDDSIVHLRSVPAIIYAFRIANVQLNSVKIMLWALRHAHDLRVPNQTRLEFSSAMQHLQEFRFVQI
ncbi:hypothetical protein V8F33_005825 [Rhypophila sp. PSN 637]